MTADLDTDLTPDLEARLARAGAHLDALAERDGAAGSSGGGPGEVAYVRRSPSSPGPGRRLALAAAVVLVVGAVAGGVVLARHDDGTSGVRTDPTSTTDPSAVTSTSSVTTTSTTLPPGVPVFEAGAVLASSPAPAGGACPPSQLLSLDGTTCFELGAVAFTDADISGAKAELLAEWTVSITLAPGSRAQANQVFDSCYPATAACPPVFAGEPGAIAYVWRNRVISAPAIYDLHLASRSLPVVGRLRGTAPSLTEAQARAIAADLQP